MSAIEREFARCWPFLAPAMKRADAPMVRDALLRQLIEGQAMLWPGERSAMVTQCLHIDGRRCIHVWLAGGDLKELLSLAPGAMAWARMIGCEHASLGGRKGWARLLPEWAWEHGELRRAL